MVMRAGLATLAKQEVILAQVETGAAVAVEEVVAEVTSSRSL